MGLHRGEGVSNKRDEEGAPNSIVLREAAVRRAGCDHGVSDTALTLPALGAVPVPLAWPRTWPCCVLWRDRCRAWQPFRSRCSCTAQQLGPGVAQAAPPGCAGWGSPGGEGQSSACWSLQTTSRGWDPCAKCPPSPPCRTAVLLFAGLAWTLLEITAATTGTFQGKGGSTGARTRPGAAWQGAGVWWGRRD